MSDAAAPPPETDAAPFPAALATTAVRMAIPTWIQLVGLPLLALLAWVVFTHAQHAVMTFVVAALIALLLNPIVRNLTRIGVPRPLGVAVVFLVFATIVAGIVFTVASITVNEANAVRHNSNKYQREAQDKVDSLEATLDKHGIHTHLRKKSAEFLDRLDEKTGEISGKALTYGSDIAQRIAEAFFNVVLVIVVTIYMLLDAPRLGRWAERNFPSERRDHSDSLFARLERALLGYVRGQALASLAMGVSAAIGLYIYGFTGIWPAATGLAIPFAVFVAVTEFAPSIGPLVGSIPPIVAALFDGPVTALLVLALFVVLHQLEGHIVVPKLMGSAIRVHPLLVIFGILTGAQLMGIGGIILALPLIAVTRELVSFMGERFELAHFSSSFGSGSATTDELEAAAAAGAAAVVSNAAAAGPAPNFGVEAASDEPGLARAARKLARRVRRAGTAGGAGSTGAGERRGSRTGTGRSNADVNDDGGAVPEGTPVPPGAPGDPARHRHEQERDTPPLDDDGTDAPPKDDDA